VWICKQAFFVTTPCNFVLIMGVFEDALVPSFAHGYTPLKTRKLQNKPVAAHGPRNCWVIPN